ncbi:MAG: CoA-binding protein, partial [Nitrososphaerales archaeon]
MSIEPGEMRPSISDLLNPTKVAVIGASDTSHIGSMLCRNILSRGGILFPVNPKYDRLYDTHCYPSVLDITEDVDAVAIAVPPELCIEIVLQCSRKGIRNIVIPGDGFADAGTQGALLQKKLEEVARKHEVAICGPNCLGFANSRGVSIWAARMSKVSEGNLSVVSQSGGLLSTLMRYEADHPIGFAYCVSSGNEVDLTCSDYMRYFVDDDNTRAIICILETIRNIDDFLSVAEEARSKRKPIIALKLGKSERGRQAALTHTGAMSGPGEFYDALFKQHGIVLVENLTELAD